MAQPDCYSIRRLAPFLGMTEVIDTGEARAVSVDGLNWQIQMRCQAHAAKWGRLDQREPVWRYARVGAWSPSEGLHRLPLDPALDTQDIERCAQALLGTLASKRRQVPFPPRDRIEWWLLDAADKRPLALLASAVDERSLPQTPTGTEWIPMRPDETSPVPGRDHGLHPQALTALVGRAAGKPASAQWFRRIENGDGVGLTGVHLEPVLRGRELPRASFPVLLLREDWENPAERALIQDFFNWQAPWLLTLPKLSPNLRDRLEHAACARPLAVDAVHRLYPRILNPDLINQALIEAALRQSAMR